MTEEFDLSEKIEDSGNWDYSVIPTGDVKEFIRLLNYYAELWNWEGSEKINELAGERLK